ncbi:MAG: SAM-dependent chlorinase/fluorinase [Acidobacteria bacterium]|nr:SAM-dependent chlorinase/fluorinase [Acidobacteriota bacterium]
MARQIITLTTDFGLADHFVGAMKGVILALAPGATIVDITHQIDAFEIAEAGFVIAQAAPWFPPRTVHVVVVDPGVGTSRRPILAEAAGQYFVAPDNGVLSMIYSRHPHRVRALTVEKYFLKTVSQTFHGRDVFAPVAAHLARGAAPSRLGRLIRDYMRLYYEKPVRTARRGWTGAILKVDRFGNLITNFAASDFPILESQPFQMTVGLRAVGRLAKNYAECFPGELFVIAGSSGYLEVSSSHTSAAKILGCGAGAPVELKLI